MPTTWGGHHNGDWAWHARPGAQGRCATPSSNSVERGVRALAKYGEAMGWTQTWARWVRNRRRVEINGVEGDRIPKRFTPAHHRRFSRGPWALLRTVVASVVALLGGLAMIVGLTLTWLQDAVVDREGFAQISQQLVQDQPLQDELIATAVDEASQTVQDQELGGLPFGGTLLNLVDERVTAAIEDYSQSQEYVNDWNEVVLTTHELNLESAGSQDGEGAPQDLEIYTAPLVDSIESHIEDNIGLGIDLDLRGEESLGGEDGIIVAAGSETGPVFDTIVDSTGQAPYWFWGGLTAVVLAVIGARHREWTFVAAGLGLFAGVLIGRRAASDVADTVTTSPDLESVGRSVVERIFELLLSGMDAALMPWLWVGVVAGVVGVVLAAARALWSWGASDTWGRAHEADDERRRRRVIEI